MRVLFIAGFAPIVRDPGAARALYTDTLGLQFEGGVGDYVFTETLAGAKHFGLWPLAEAAETCFGRRNGRRTSRRRTRRSSSRWTTSRPPRASWRRADTGCCIRRA